MRRDRKSKVKKERMIMIASSALVMGALTLTGIYMKDRSAENVDDGYTVDFSQLENGVDDKAQEIAQNQQEISGQLDMAQKPAEDPEVDPLEAGSGLVEIPGLTDQDTQLSLLQGLEDLKNLEGLESLKDLESLAGSGVLEDVKDAPDKDERHVDADKDRDKHEDADDRDDDDKAKKQETISETVTKKLSFTEEQGLARPVSGEILMYYSMDKSIYFATLDQYKYNPAVVLSAVEGDAVTVCADAKILSVFENEEIGCVVTLDLGNGYQAVYGQLKNLQYTEGAYVNRGDMLGSVAAPTKYYCVEGPNLYFQLTKDGNPVNPEGLFR